ncbi:MULTISPECIES: hypothetical protein [Roseobacteraceae]|uniref:hypothetical protein n=1 Tax=Roseobacteraceae TaxID=2854170 RepID=UPI00125EE873|nr:MULTISPECIES: hypothetical protein [Roseobacteraceae]KAB6716897.1 hypothetical protein C8029_08275 [Roseobacter sp. TSBP12]|tara:strand:- start:4029 stop:4493 length:465 start_codon:yes stop_codon:yes gene_type:complete
MMGFRGVFALFIATLPLAAQAQETTLCDWRASAASVVEPWDENARTFANGAVRLALLDTIEPAAAAFHVLVLSPPFDEVGGRQCRIISADAAGSGFEAIDFAALEADYEPSTGLLFMMPARLYDPEDGPAKMGRLSFALNQATGEIATLFEAAK